MYTNFFIKDFKGLALKEILWRAAKLTTVVDYNFWMQKESKPAYEWLLDRPANEWSKSHFLTKVKSDILLNNLCECFNKLLLEDREKSIETMLIDMHISTMKRIQTRRDKMRRVIGPLYPKTHDKLVKNLEVADGSKVDWRWDLIGIPCGHACVAIIEKMDLHVHYVNDCYKVSTYLTCYENLVMPLNGKKLWPLVDKAPLSPPKWHVTKRGKRQKKMRLQAKEVVVKLKSGTSKIKRIGSIVMTCSLCGLPGHNKRYHNKADTPCEVGLLHMLNII
ncbi:uncharacterized protein LOC127799657 [Diospyros lotus]|uniref:uncharacterized protein LOC127799657 n=1 Tax=Diospyros lotus TaxID=55363 RepID=UPI00225C11E3|nr:uncharacterized protein LOC127799657 [Diospyros lotus]